jgi:glycosyltransferase involved in cell wall biosynthesis
MKVGRTLAEVARSERIDVVQFPEYRAESLAYSVMGRIPYVVRFSTPSWFVDEINGRAAGGGPRTRFNRALSRWSEDTAARRARALIFPSRDLMQRLRSALGLTGTCRVIYPGVDAARFRPIQDPAARRARGIGPGPVVLYVGRFEWRKGVHVLAEAAPRIAARVPGVRFVFVGGDSRSAPGGGSMRALIEAIAQREGLADRFHLIDGVPHAQIEQVYGLGDVLVVPSLYENLANVLLEGMAAGLPIVTTSAGGSPEVVEHGINGLVVPPADAAAVADATCLLLADTRQREQIGLNNRKKALEAFTLERMAAETAAVFESIREATDARAG